MTLADGRTQTTEILTTSVDIGIQGKVIATELIISKYAKATDHFRYRLFFFNSCRDCLRSQKENSGISRKHPTENTICESASNINFLLTVDTEPHVTCQFRKMKELTFHLQRKKSNSALLENMKNAFNRGL
ncbi:hypothetical protein TNCV_1082661 [Trichonephila clavipes]|nr:hypothetical protein TNCV_1082661 [Trichonephila clavipes]